MVCSECGHEQFKAGKCLGCGHTSHAQSQYPTKTGRTDTTILRNCDYKTGSWQCQWRQWASDRDDFAYCDFHKRVLEDVRRHGPDYATGKPLWDTFSAEWEFNHDPRQRHSKSWAYPDGTIPDTPFWYLPIQESWRRLTGLPLPEEWKGLWDQGQEEPEPHNDHWQEDDPILAGKTDFEKGQLIGAELVRKIQTGERIRPLKGLTFSEWKQKGEPRPQNTGTMSEPGGFTKI
jgi:hypothetical protein